MGNPVPFSPPVLCHLSIKDHQRTFAGTRFTRKLICQQEREAKRAEIRLCQFCLWLLEAHAEFLPLCLQLCWLKFHVFRLHPSLQISICLWSTCWAGSLVCQTSWSYTTRNNPVQNNSKAMRCALFGFLFLFIDLTALRCPQSGDSPPLKVPATDIKALWCMNQSHFSHVLDAR